MFSYPEQMTTVEDSRALRDDLGQALRRARSARGLSLRELAARIGVSPATLSAVENGRTGLVVDRLQLIAAELGTTAAELLSDDKLASTPLPQPPAGAGNAGSATGDWRGFQPLPIDPVLQAAITAFVDTGYHGASMRAIAERAVLSVPGLYHHYRNKQELLVRIFDITMADLLWRAAAARAEGALPVRRVALIVEAMALFHTHRRELAFIGASEMRSLEPANRRRIAALRSDLQHALDAEIDAAIADGTLGTAIPRAGARAISTMCTSLPQWFRVAGRWSPEQIASEYAQFALELLGYRGGAAVADLPATAGGHDFPMPSSSRSTKVSAICSGVSSPAGLIHK